MNKYKTYKISRTKRGYIREEVEVKIPTWRYKILMWLFGDEEAYKQIIWEDRKTAYDNVSKNAQGSKEIAIYRKLNELGYEVKSNLPRVKPISDTTVDQMPDYDKLFEVVKKLPITLKDK